VAIQFACPVCETVYTVNDRNEGQTVECRACGQLVRVPAASPSAPRDAEALADADIPTLIPEAIEVPVPRYGRRRRPARPRRADSGLIVAVLVGTGLVCAALGVAAVYWVWAGHGATAGGRRIDIGEGQLWWYPPVTETEAQRLAAFLGTSGWGKTPGTYGEIRRRPEGAYQFRVPIKAGLDRDEETVFIFQLLAAGLSKDVFRGQDVEIHLCDDHMRTLRMVVSP
jgi:hypothetical protein